MARLRARVGKRLSGAEAPARTAKAVLARSLRLTGAFGYATAGAGAIVAGVLVGGAYTAAPEPASLLSVLRPAPIPVLADAR